jgi:hypothetical protein
MQGPASTTVECRTMSERMERHTIESTEDTVLGHVDIIVARGADILYQKYLNDKIVPYAARWLWSAISELLSMIELGKNNRDGPPCSMFHVYHAHLLNGDPEGVDRIIMEPSMLSSSIDDWARSIIPIKPMTVREQSRHDGSHMIDLGDGTNSSDEGSDNQRLDKSPFVECRQESSLMTTRSHRSSSSKGSPNKNKRSLKDPRSSSNIHVDPPLIHPLHHPSMSHEMKVSTDPYDELDQHSIAGDARQERRNNSSFFMSRLDGEGDDPLKKFEREKALKNDEESSQQCEFVSDGCISPLKNKTSAVRGSTTALAAPILPSVPVEFHVQDVAPPSRKNSISMIVHSQDEALLSKKVHVQKRVCHDRRQSGHTRDTMVE